MLEAINLTKRYGGHEALSNLNLSVAQGEIFCLLGQNGAGKTTTINLFLGLLAATSGTAFMVACDATNSLCSGVSAGFCLQENTINVRAKISTYFISSF